MADAEDGRGGSWSMDGTIVFSPKPEYDSLYAVSLAGGTVSAVTHFDKQRNEDSHRWPRFLPDGRHIVFCISSTTTPSGVNESDPVAGVYLCDRKTGKQTLLLHADSAAQYANGYLLYLRQQNLMAQPFDPASGKFSGSAVPVAEGVQYNSDRWIGAFDASASGMLAYIRGAGAQSQLVWYGRDGKEQGRLGNPSPHDAASISPDGTRVVTGLGGCARRQPRHLDL